MRGGAAAVRVLTLTVAAAALCAGRASGGGHEHLNEAFDDLHYPLQDILAALQDAGLVHDRNLTVADLRFDLGMLPRPPDHHRLYKRQLGNEIPTLPFRKLPLPGASEAEDAEDCSQCVARPLEVCTSRTRTMYPIRMNDTRGVVHFIPNIVRTFEQPVYESVCAGGAECNLVLGECRQQYRLQTLLIYTPPSRQLIQDTFRVPTACTCHASLQIFP